MKKKFLIVFITAFFLVVNFVVVAAFQQKQTLKSQAAATTSLSFYPPSSFSNPIRASVGQPLSIELRMAPGNNKISKLQVHIVFPKGTFAISSARFDVDTSVFPQVDVAPRVTEGANGDINFTVSNPAGIAYETKIGILTLTPTKLVTEANQNDGVVGFLPVTSGVSIREGDSPTENAVVQLNQAYIYVSNESVPGPVLTTPGAGGGGSPAPTQFTCLGSCPISPTEPAINDGSGGNPTGGGNQNDNQTVSPTPCPETQVSSNSSNDVQANHKKKWKKHRGGGNRDGLLKILIQLLELLIKLLGGGTTAPGGTTPGGGNPCKPATVPDPAEPPQASEAPNQPEPSVVSEAPATSPSTPVSAALCGKKTAGASAGSLPSCSGLTATQPTSNGFYNVTNFGCNTGFPKDSADNCIPACSGAPECSGLDGRACEEKVIWYSANADQYGCNAKLKVTNPKTGKAVIVRALDKGPGCSIQKSKGVFDMSQAAYKEINGDDGVVQVEKVAESTPLGPIPACTQ